MTNLSTIPVELLTDIIAQLDDSTLLNLSLCSRFLNTITTPYIYHYVNLNKVRDLRKFAALMLEKPMLASLVKCFAMHQDDAATTFHFDVDRSVDLHHRLLRGVKSRGYSEWLEEQCIEDLTWECGVDTLIALLLPTLTSVEWLDVLPYFKIQLLPLQWMGMENHETHTSSLFNNLTHIGGLVQRKETAGHRFKLAEAEMLLRLPSLRSFSAGICLPNSGMYTEFHSPWLLPAKSSNVTYLELRNVDLPAADVTRLVSWCGNLKTFILEWSDEKHSLGFSLLKIAEAYKICSSAANSLENLSLEYGVFEANSIRSNFSTEPISSLVPWQNLKHLRLGALYLIGGFGLWDEDVLNGRLAATSHLCEILPPNIEKLSLSCNLFHDPYNPLIEALDKVVTVAPERFPKLSRIDLEILREPFEMRWWWSQDRESRFETAQNHAAEANISLQFREFYWTEQYWGMEKLFHAQPKISAPRGNTYDCDACHPR